MSQLSGDNNDDNLIKNRLRDPLFPDECGSPLIITPETKGETRTYSPRDTGMSSLFLAAGVPVNFPTADIFTPVVKELAGGRNKVKYFKIRASLGAAPVSSTTATTSSSFSFDQQPTARTLFDNIGRGKKAANNKVPSMLCETSAYEHDTRREDTRASIRRGERLHASLVKSGVLPALPRNPHQSLLSSSSSLSLSKTPSKGRSLIPGRRGLRPGAASSDGAGASPLRTTPTRRCSRGWDIARQAAARAALDFESHQRRVDAAVVIQFKYRRMKRIERLRNVLRLTCLLVRHRRMERAAAGETVEGISEETLAEARAQAVRKWAKWGGCIYDILCSLR